jgi:hypothetical protein
MEVTFDFPATSGSYVVVLMWKVPMGHRRVEDWTTVCPHDHLTGDPCQNQRPAEFDWNWLELELIHYVAMGGSHDYRIPRTTGCAGSSHGDQGLQLINSRRHGSGTALQLANMSNLNEVTPGLAD